MVQQTTMTSIADKSILTPLKSICPMLVVAQAVSMTVTRYTFRWKVPPHMMATI